MKVQASEFVDQASALIDKAAGYFPSIRKESVAVAAFSVARRHPWWSLLAVGAVVGAWMVQKRYAESIAS